jgi:hypothetical protein
VPELNPYFGAVQQASGWSRELADLVLQLEVHDNSTSALTAELRGLHHE